MRTCTWFPRRHAGRLVLTAAMVVGASVVATTEVASTGASADPIADKRAQASALAQKIQSLGQEEDALSERYDQATLNLQAAQNRVSQATRLLAADRAAESQARASLTTEAVDAYVNGGNEAPQATLKNQPLTNVNQSLVRDEYLGNLTSDQNDVVDQYHLAALKTNDDRSQLQVALAAAKNQQATLAQDRSAVQASATQLQGTLNSVNGQIATLVAQAQLAQEQAEARAAQQRLAAQQQAAAQQAAAQQAAAQLAASQHAAAQQAATQQAAAAQQGSGLGGTVKTATSPSTTTSGSGGSTTSGSTPATTTATPVAAPGGSLQAAAIAAAESRLGDPYVWGAAGPDSFDCSGLVMWSYAQAGYSLPHYSGSQYAVTIHIPLSEVQPGDLVFPADPGEHVAMYIGGGNIIEAPFTGEDVHIVPLSNFFVYASRVP